MPNVPAPATADVLSGIGLIPTDPADVPAPDPVVPPAAPAAPAAPAPVEPPAPAVPAAEPDPSGAQNPDAYQRAIAAERKAAKEANARARELQARLEAEQNAARPLSEQVATANAQRDAAALTATRYEVAAEVGLDITLASRLSGSTREELLADAESFKAQVGGAAPAPTIPPEGGLRETPPAKPNPGQDHNDVILGLLQARQGGGAASTSPGILAGLEPAPAE